MSTRNEKKRLFIMYFVYFVSMFCFAGVRIISAKGFGDDWNYYLRESFYTIIIQLIIMVLLPLVLYMLLTRSKISKVKQTARINRMEMKAVVICFLIGIIIYFLNIAISSFFNNIIDIMGYETPIIFSSAGQSPSGGIGFFVFELVTIAVLPALCEEFMHRGLLLGSIERIGFKKSLLISSVLFGLMHFSINKVFYAIILGLIMGFMVIITKNIWAGVIVHFMNNGINVYLSHAKTNGWFLGGFSDSLQTFFNNGNKFVSFVICLIFLIIAIVLLLWLLFKLYKNTTLKTVNEAIESVYKNIHNSDDTILLDEGLMVQELIETNSTLNVNFDYVNNPIDIMLPKQKTKIKDGIGVNLFLVASIVLGVSITISTFVWGLL